MFTCCTAAKVEKHELTMTPRRSPPSKLIIDLALTSTVGIVDAEGEKPAAAPSSTGAEIEKESEGQSTIATTTEGKSEGGDKARKCPLNFNPSNSENSSAGGFTSTTEAETATSASTVAEAVGPSPKMSVDATEAEAAEAYGVSLVELHLLRGDFPEAPPAECARYLARGSACGLAKKASPLLRTYLNWRQKDLANFEAPPANLPLHLRCHGLAKDGSRILHFLATTIDPKFTPEQHAQAALMYIDGQLSRGSTERLTVLFDCRGYEGLTRNRNVFDIWRHAMALPKVFSTYFPERISRVIIYPVDDIAKNAWYFVKHVVPPATAKRVVFLSGSSKMGSVSPPDLIEYFDVKEIAPESHRFFLGLPGCQQ